MRILTASVGILVAGMVASAAAAEPERLNDRALDAVTAGLFSGGSVGFTGGASTVGASATLSLLSFSQFTSATTLTPPTFTTQFNTLGIGRVQAVASGVGPTSANASAGAASAIFLVP